VSVPTSGQYLFDPSLSDLTLEAFARVQIYPTSLTPQHMLQARLSANLLLSDWSNQQPNLWAQDLQTVPLVTSVSTYTVPNETVTILDAYIRQFEVGNTTNLTNAFSTTNGSPTITVAYANHGLVPGNALAVVTPVAIGGLVLLGFYFVASVIDANTFTFTALQNATGTVSGGGALPILTTTAGSALVSVTLPNHGLTVGSNFSIQILTAVGGLSLQGTYPVTAVASSSAFTINAGATAGANATVTENGGAAAVSTQLPDVDPIDRPIMPISRTDYSMFPDKVGVGFPTVYFFLRTISPTITIWQPPDNNGPYVLQYWRVRQMQDAVMANGATLDLPYRFYDAFAAGLAAKLARKYAPQLVADLRMEAAEAYLHATQQDTETLVPMHITAGLTSYYR
jgi:hypothetical protein